MVGWNTGRMLSSKLDLYLQLPTYIQPTKGFNVNKYMRTLLVSNSVVISNNKWNMNRVYTSKI